MGANKRRYYFIAQAAVILFVAGAFGVLYKRGCFKPDPAAPWVSVDEGRAAVFTRPIPVYME